ncbi:MAG: UDP-3-O-(3-hydroxymyristoyl)glucosamine N-acyltransferase [Gemmatimonadales bacterium]
MSAPLTAAEAAALVGGELVGDGATPLAAVAPLDRAGPGDLSVLASGKYLAEFQASQAGAVLCRAEHREARPGPATRIVVPDPHRALLQLVGRLYPPPPRLVGVHPTAVVEPGAVLGAEVALGAHVVVGAGARLGDRVTVMAGSVIGAGVEVGDDTTLHPSVVLYPGARIGNRVILHAGVRIAVDGFGYVRGPEGHVRIPHVGRAIIGDDVEIGANSTVDRGSVDDTVIGPGTKMDNLVQVGHNCRIGARCLLMAQVGVAGSMRVEDDVILAGQVGLGGHFTVGKGARIGAQSGVMADVPAGASYFGYPARPVREAMRGVAALARLTKIVDQLEELVERDSPAGK